MAEAERLLRGAVADISSLTDRWALIGGLAFAFRVEPRTTRDVELAVAVESDDQAEALVFELGRRGYEVLASLEHEVSARLATVRLKPPDDMSPTAIVDLLFASSGIEPELVEAAERLEVIPRLVAPVAVAGHLVALKLLAVADHRPYDAGDLQALLRTGTEHDVEVARRAVLLIAERGYNRGRDLEAALDEAVARWR